MNPKVPTDDMNDGPLLCQVGRLYTLEMLCPSTCNLSGTWKVLLKSIFPQPKTGWWGKFHNKVTTKSEISTIFHNLCVDPIWAIRFLGLKVCMYIRIFFSANQLFLHNSLQDHVETHGHRRAHLVEGYSLGCEVLPLMSFSRKTNHTLTSPID